MQRKQEEMKNFRQQLMQIPAFKAMFPDNSQGEPARVEDNNNDSNNKEKQTSPPLMENQSVPIIHLEPQNSGDAPQPRLEVSQPKTNIIPTVIPVFSQVQMPTIPNLVQRTGPQAQPIQNLHDVSVHQPISVPQRVHATSQYVTKDDMIDVINQLRRQTSRPSELDFTPPYPAHIRRQPYPTGYIEHPP